MEKRTKIILLATAAAAVAGVAGYFIYKKMKNTPPTPQGGKAGTKNKLDKIVIPNPAGQDRASRNNNPLNIRNSSDTFDGELGTDGSFKTFKSGAYGVRAAFKILKTYETGHGKKTLREKLERWAPSSENSKTYADEVAKMAGVDVEQFAGYNNLNLWLQVMPAWAKREGYYPLKESEVKEGFQLAGFSS